MHFNLKTACQYSCIQPVPPNLQKTHNTSSIPSEVYLHTSLVFFFFFWPSLRCSRALGRKKGGKKLLYFNITQKKNFLFSHTKRVSLWCCTPSLYPSIFPAYYFNISPFFSLLHLLVIFFFFLVTLALASCSRSSPIILSFLLCTPPSSTVKVCVCVL